MLYELNSTQNSGLRNKIDYGIVKPIIWTKYKLGLEIEEAIELHRPIRRKFKKTKSNVFNIYDIWSANLDTSKDKISTENNGYKYLLNVINIFQNILILFLFKSKLSDPIIEVFKYLNAIIVNQIT